MIPLAFLLCNQLHIHAFPFFLHCIVSDSFVFHLYFALHFPRSPFPLPLVLPLPLCLPLPFPFAFASPQGTPQGTRQITFSISFPVVNYVTGKLVRIAENVGGVPLSPPNLCSTGGELTGKTLTGNDFGAHRSAKSLPTEHFEHHTDPVEPM